jgi:hypothetical protein
MTTGKLEGRRTTANPDKQSVPVDIFIIDRQLD